MVRYEGDVVTRAREKAEEARWEQFSEDMLEGWRKSVADPADLFQAFPPLSLKKGYVLHSYQYREGRDGNGVIWAMPKDVAFPEPEACELFELPRHAWSLEMVPGLIPPRPDGALADMMEAVEGDGTPWSYLCASLLAREAAEFGAFGHGSFWSAFFILSGDPFEGRDEQSGQSVGYSLPDGEVSDWVWHTPAPREWRTGVRVNEMFIEVTFYTFCGLGGQIITHHKDTYAPGGYQFEAADEVIASGPDGYVY